MNSVVITTPHDFIASVNDLNITLPNTNPMATHRPEIMDLIAPVTTCRLPSSFLFSPLGGTSIYNIPDSNLSIYTTANHASDPLSIFLPCCSTWMPPFRDSLYFATNSSENQAIGLHFPTYGSPNPNCGDKPTCEKMNLDRTTPPNQLPDFKQDTPTLVLPLKGEG